VIWTPQPFDYVLQVEGVGFPGGGTPPGRLVVGIGQQRSVLLDGDAPFVVRSVHSGQTASDAVIAAFKLSFGAWGDLISDYMNLPTFASFGMDLPEQIRMNPADRINATFNATVAGGNHTVYRGVKLRPEGGVYLGPSNYKEEGWHYRKQLNGLPYTTGAGATLSPFQLFNVPVEIDDDADFVLQWMQAYSSDAIVECRMTLKDGWTRPMSNVPVDIQVMCGPFGNNDGTEHFRTFANGIVYPKGKPIMFDLYNWGPMEAGTLDVEFAFGGVKRYQ